MQALEALRQSLDHRTTAIASEDFYVLGRIAEEYGLPAKAATAYRRVEKPATPYSLSSFSYALAQRRYPRVAAVLR